MDSTVKQVLVVANRTAATERLLRHIDGRAAMGPCEFTLLVPDATDKQAGNWTLEEALPLIRKAARPCPVRGLVGGPDPFESVQDALRDGSYDEIIVSTLPKGVSKWLRRDLVRQIKSLGLPVKTIIPGDNVVRDATDYIQGPPGAMGW